LGPAATLAVASRSRFQSKRGGAPDRRLKRIVDEAAVQHVPPSPDLRFESLLPQSEAARYLLDRGLLTPAAIVDGDVRVRDASSRNLNFKVECSLGASYLMKQGLGPEAVATVTREAGAYEYLSKYDSVRPYLPNFHGYDAERQVLVLELIRGGTDLRSYHRRRGRFGVGLAESLGRALGAVHRATTFTHEPAPAPERAPFVFSLHRPDSRIFRDLSATSIELIKIVQHARSLSKRLDGLRASWSPSAMIHQDVKWDNVIVLAAVGWRVGPRLKLIDWEGAVEGDPCWDVGSAFSNFLSTWLFSIPITGQSPPEDFPKLARYQLEKMQPAIRRFWDSYTAEVGADPATAHRRLLRSVEFAGARLVQTAFEVAQVSMSLNGAIVLHLQLAENVLDRSAEAAVQLLGVPLYRAAA
jgi:aminoglycoside phosphotransferase (APT) family kinase protein